MQRIDETNPNVRALLADAYRDLRAVTVTALTPRERNRAIRSHIRAFFAGDAAREMIARTRRNPYEIEISAAELVEIYGLDRETARRVRDILHKGPDPEWTGHVSHAVHDWLEEAGAMIPRTCGVEWIEPEPRRAAVAYLNTGDMYDRTIVADPASGRAYVSAWGDEVESAEEERTEETGDVRCAYCGEWIEADGRDPATFRDWTCDSCGHTWEY